MYGTVKIGPPRLGIPPSECMIPGETYVGIPPGHSRPAFVRKRPVDAGRPPWFLTNIFGSSKRAYTVEGPPSSGMFRRSSWRDRCDRYERSYYPYGTPYTNRYNPQVSFARPGTVHDTPLGPVAARVNQVCGSCGRYRSASWQARHPLAPGESGSSALCRRCENKRSSSDDYERRHHIRSRHHRRSRRYTYSTDGSSYEREPRHPRRRYYADSPESRSRRSSSKGDIQVVVANQIGDRPTPTRHLTPGSSVDDGVRLIRREEVIDVPERRRVSRTRSRTFSGDSYVEDGGRFIEDLERRRYYSPPRHVSRTRYVEEVEVPRYHSRPRSNSHVAFVDEIEEPIVISRSRRLSRRRSMRFDGAADDGGPEYGSPGRLHSMSRRSRSRSTSSEVLLIEEPVSPHAHSIRKAIEPDRGIQLIEKTVIEPKTSYYESEHEARSRSRSPSINRPEAFIETLNPPSLYRTHDETTPVVSRRGSYHSDFDRADSPRRQSRRRYRESDITSDTDAESTYTPLHYRHVGTPSPRPLSPSPQADYLAEMLAKAQITPPGDQEKLRDLRYARGRASQRRYDDTPPPSAEYHRSEFHWDDAEDRAERESDVERYEAQDEYEEGERPRMEEEQTQSDGYNWMD